TGGVPHRIQQDPRLETASAPEFDQESPWPDGVYNLLCMLLHDLQLGAREVVHIELRYLIEETRSLLIVEILWRKALGATLKTIQNIPLKPLPLGRFAPLTAHRRIRMEIGGRRPAITTLEFASLRRHGQVAVR